MFKTFENGNHKKIVAKSSKINHHYDDFYRKSGKENSILALDKF